LTLYRPYFLIPPPGGPPVQPRPRQPFRPGGHLFLTFQCFTFEMSAIASSNHVVLVPLLFAFCSASASAFFFALNAASSSSSSFFSFFDACEKLQRLRICIVEWHIYLQRLQFAALSARHRCSILSAEL
jgi:hypothetical protein